MDGLHNSERNGGSGFDPEFYEMAVGDDQDMDDIITRMMDTQIALGGGGAAPASPAAIANLKKKKVDRGMLDADGRANCTVCFDDVIHGELVTELPCKHWFHEGCINAWLSSHGICPHCRVNISMDDAPNVRKDLAPAESPHTGHGSQHSSKDQRVVNALRENYNDDMHPRMRNFDDHPSLHDDEAYARMLQYELDHTVPDDLELARMLSEESQPSVYDDEALARRLYEENRPLAYNDHEMARRLHDESEAMAIRRQEENYLTVRDDEAMARRLQEESYRDGTNARPDQEPG